MNRSIRYPLRRGAAVMLLVAFAALDVAAQTRSAPGGGLPPRDEYQRVPDILAALRVAAGDGYLTRPLAKQVGAAGRVYAVEISEDARRKLAQLIERDTLDNVEVIASTETDPRLPAALDGAVILNSYHELTDYKAVLEGIRRALKPGGLFVLVDNAAGQGWFTERADQASHHALDPKYVGAELRAAGFEIVDRQDRFIVQPYAQWLIVARRSR